MDNRTRNIEIAVGEFVLVCISIAVVIFSVLLQKEHTFEPRINVSAVFENARGLRPGAPVWLSGIGVGSVQWVGFDDKNQVLVIMSLLNTAQQRVHQDAVARIVSMSLVGTDTMILLTTGSPTEPLIADGNREVAQKYDMIHPNADDTLTDHEQQQLDQQVPISISFFVWQIHH